MKISERKPRYIMSPVLINLQSQTELKFRFDQGSHAYPKFSLGISPSNEKVLYKVMRGKKKVVYKEQAQDIIRNMHYPGVYIITLFTFSHPYI